MILTRAAFVAEILPEWDILGHYETPSYSEALPRFNRRSKTTEEALVEEFSFRGLLLGGLFVVVRSRGAGISFKDPSWAFRSAELGWADWFYSAQRGILC
jgi:hypothetical protein